MHIRMCPQLQIAVSVDAQLVEPIAILWQQLLLHLCVLQELVIGAVCVCARALNGARTHAHLSHQVHSRGAGGHTDAQFAHFACAHIGRIHSYDVGSRFCGKPTGV